MADILWPARRSAKIRANMEPNVTILTPGSKMSTGLTSGRNAQKLMSIEARPTRPIPKTVFSCREYLLYYAKLEIDASYNLSSEELPNRALKIEGMVPST